MRYLAIGLAIFSLQTNVFADEYRDCSLIDRDLIYCPIVNAPPITELREGFVLLNYIVKTDGSVTGIEVIDSEPKGMWDKAVVDTITQWKFKPQNDDVKKQWRFTAEIE